MAKGINIMLDVRDFKACMARRQTHTTSTEARAQSFAEATGRMVHACIGGKGAQKETDSTVFVKCNERLLSATND